MKVAQIMLFLFVLNAAFILLNVTGIYFYDVPSEGGSGDIDTSVGKINIWDINSIGVLAFVDFAISVVTGILLARYGINPFMVAAYTAFLFTFILFYGMFVGILYGVGGMMEDAKPLMETFIGILTVIMAILVLYTSIQMATGGAKSYE